ncbi:MAG: hypothetical protein KDI30_11270, partial [Pseudomonadales bacterium]|nr:hypothetical protein [Pseudomonadales bacterium]
RMYSLVQQTIVIFVLCLLDQLVASWMSALSGYTPESLFYFMPVITSAALWPCFFYFIKNSMMSMSRL